MSKKVKRNKELTNKQANFYCELGIKSKSKRLRKKGTNIIEFDYNNFYSLRFKDNFIKSLFDF